MSINVVVTVADGVVMAADSAISLKAPDRYNPGKLLDQTYPHSIKILQLAKPYPVGLMFCGSAMVGDIPLVHVMKFGRYEIAQELSNLGQPPSHNMLSSTPTETPYTVKFLAETAAEIILSVYRRQCETEAKPVPEIVLFVAGYGPTDLFPSVCRVDIGPEHATVGSTVGYKCAVLTSSKEPQGTVFFDGMYEPLSRLLHGFSPLTRARLTKVFADSSLDLPPDARTSLLKFTDMLFGLSKDCQPAVGMPLQDAIEYTRFLAQVSVFWSRFNPGPDSVGGEIDIATINRFEGFKWIHRKHYWESELNPDSVEAVQYFRWLDELRRRERASGNQPEQPTGESTA